MLALQLHVKGRSHLKFFSRSLYIVKNYKQQTCRKLHIKPAVGLYSNNRNEKLNFLQTSRLLCQRQLFHSSHCLPDNNKDSLHSKSNPNKDPAVNKVKVNSSRISSDGYETMFSYGTIVLYQVVSRLKIYQSVGTIGLLLGSLYSRTSENLFDSTLLAFGVSSSVVLLGLFTASFYIKKIVGILGINNTGDQIKLAHVTYWGRRENLFIPIDNLVLPLQSDGEKYLVRLKNSPDVFYLIPSKSNYYNPYLMDKVFGKLD